MANEDTIRTMIDLLSQSGVSTDSYWDDTEGGGIWLVFPSAVDCERFLTIVANHLQQTPIDRFCDPVYWRMGYSRHTNAWRYECMRVDANAFDDRQEMVTTTPARFQIVACVWLPHADSDPVMEALRRAIARAGMN